jgi:hypothetical protein
MACDGERQNTDLWPNPVDPIPAPLEIPDMVDDFVPLNTLDIDRTDPQGWKAGANCIASSPMGEHVAEVQTAFDRVEQRGDSCASIASHGRDLVQQVMIRIYPNNVQPQAGDGSSSLGRPVHLSDHWFNFDPSSTIRVNDSKGSTVRLSLEIGLVHKIEYNLGRPPVEINGFWSLFRTTHV